MLAILFGKNVYKNMEERIGGSVNEQNAATVQVHGSGVGKSGWSCCDPSSSGRISTQVTCFCYKEQKKGKEKLFRDQKEKETR